MQTARRKVRILAIGFVYSLLAAPFAAFCIFHLLYGGELYKEYPVLSDIGFFGAQIKIASAVLYILAWGLAFFLLWCVRRQRSDEHHARRSRPTTTTVA